MEYKTDAQRRMSEVLDKLSLDATYFEKDELFLIKQGTNPVKDFIIHEKEYDEETLHGIRLQPRSYIKLGPDGTLTYDNDGSKAVIKLCKKCGKFYFGRKLSNQADACPYCGGKSSKCLANGKIPSWYGKESVPRLINKDEIEKQRAIVNEKDLDRFDNLVDRLTGTPRYISIDEEKRQKISDLAKKFPNMQEPIDYILQCVNTASLKKNKDLSFKPFVLVGGPGCGKTAFVTELCKIIMDKYALKVDLGNEVADFTLTGTDPNFHHGRMGLIAKSLLAEHEDGHPLKNPVIHMDELDKVKVGKEYSVEKVFYAILEQCNAKRLFDNYLGVDVDASGINYIFTANTMEGIPKPILSRLRMFTIRNYTHEELRSCVLDSFYENWLCNKDMERNFLPRVLSDDIKERILDLSHDDPRSIEDAIGEVFTDTTTTDQESGHVIALFSSEEMSLGWKKFRGQKSISKAGWELPENFAKRSASQELRELLDAFDKASL